MQIREFHKLRRFSDLGPNFGEAPYGSIPGWPLRTAISVNSPDLHGGSDWVRFGNTLWTPDGSSLNLQLFRGISFSPETQRRQPIIAERYYYLTEDRKFSEYYVRYIGAINAAYLSSPGLSRLHKNLLGQRHLTVKHPLTAYDMYDLSQWDIYNLHTSDMSPSLLLENLDAVQNRWGFNTFIPANMSSYDLDGFIQNGTQILGAASTLRDNELFPVLPKEDSDAIFSATNNPDGVSFRSIQNNLIDSPIMDRVFCDVAGDVFSADKNVFRASEEFYQTAAVVDKHVHIFDVDLRYILQPNSRKHKSYVASVHNPYAAVSGISMSVDVVALTHELPNSIQEGMSSLARSLTAKGLEVPKTLSADTVFVRMIKTQDEEIVLFISEFAAGSKDDVFVYIDLAALRLCAPGAFVN